MKSRRLLVVVLVVVLCRNHSHALRIFPTYLSGPFWRRESLAVSRLLPCTFWSICLPFLLRVLSFQRGRGGCHGVSYCQSMPNTGKMSVFVWLSAWPTLADRRLLLSIFPFFSLFAVFALFLYVSLSG
jgi:hypothetical protein